MHAAFQKANVLYVIARQWITLLVGPSIMGPHKAFAHNGKLASAMNRCKSEKEKLSYRCVAEIQTWFNQAIPRHRTSLDTERHRSRRCVAAPKRHQRAACRCHRPFNEFIWSPLASRSTPSNLRPAQLRERSADSEFVRFLVVNYRFSFVL